MSAIFTPLGFFFRLPKPLLSCTFAIKHAAFEERKGFAKEHSSFNPSSDLLKIFRCRISSPSYQAYCFAIHDGY